MALKTQKIGIDFGLGVDEFTDRKLVKEGRLLKAENLVFREGRTIEKRNGYDGEVMNDLDGAPVEPATNIHEYKNSPVVFSKNNIYVDAFSETGSDNAKWRNTEQFNFQVDPNIDDIGYFPPPTDSSDPVSEIKDISLDISVLPSRGVKCVVWSATSGSTGSPNNFFGVSIKDIETDNEMFVKKITRDDITKWSCVKVIPWSSSGSEPDRFIIFASGYNTTISKHAYYVYLVGLNSTSAYYIDEGEELYDFIGLDHASAMASIFSSNYTDPGPGGFGPWPGVANYKYFSVFIDEETSHIYFVHAPVWENVDWWIYTEILEIQQATSSSPFTGDIISTSLTPAMVNNAMAQPGSDGPPPDPVIDAHMEIGFGGQKEIHFAFATICGNPTWTANASAGPPPTPTLTPQTIWESAYQEGIMVKYVAPPLRRLMIGRHQTTDPTDHNAKSTILVAMSSQFVDSWEDITEFEKYFQNRFSVKNLVYHKPDIQNAHRDKYIVAYIAEDEPFNVVSDYIKGWPVCQTTNKYTLVSHIATIDWDVLPQELPYPAYENVPIGFEGHRVIDWVKPQAGIKEYANGTGAHEKKFLLFPVVKRRSIVTLDTDDFGTTFLMCLEIDDMNYPMGYTDGDELRICRPIMKALPNSSLGSNTDPTSIPKLELSGDSLFFPMVKLPTINTHSIVNVTTNLDGTSESVELDGSLYTSGGFMKTFNGKEYIESGFHFRPDIYGLYYTAFGAPDPSEFRFTIDAFSSEIDQELDTSVVNFLNPETATYPAYQVVFIYEWTDGNGNVYRSEASEIITIQGTEQDVLIGTYDAVTPNDRGSVTIGIVNMDRQLTEKDNVIIKGYRTLRLTSDIDSDDDESSEISNGTTPTVQGIPGLFYYDGCLEMPNDDTMYGGRSNFVFNTPDEDLVGRDTLYISLQEVSNIPPPSIDRVKLHDGRVFTLSSDERNKLYYSKPKFLNGSLEFSNRHTVEVSAAGGDIENIASFMGRLFLFKRNSIYFTYGNPKNSSGLAGGYAPPGYFSNSVGTTNPESVHVTDSGLFFQYFDDIYMIDKNLQLQKVGLEVGKSMSSISSIVEVPRFNEVRIMHDEGTATYNLLFQQWTTSNLKTKGDSMLINGVHYALDKDSGTILKENDELYEDLDMPIMTDMETAWIKLAGPQGFQRVRELTLLGNLDSDTNFRLELYYNYNQYPAETVSIKASDIASLETLGAEPFLGDSTYSGGTDIDRVFQFKHKPKVQKCESIKIRIVEETDTPTKGFSLNNLMLEIGIKSPLYQLKESKIV